MSLNNEKIYRMVEVPADQVVRLGRAKTKKNNQVGYNRRGCAVGVLSFGFFAKLFYPSGLPP